MKNLMMLLGLLALTACGAGGAPGEVAPKIGPVVPSNPVAPIIPGPNTIPVTVYKLAKTEAPLSGDAWVAKKVTTTASCVHYGSNVYCWDDGIKTLEFDDFQGYHHGPYYYTYWHLNFTNIGSFRHCYGSCFQDAMTVPRLAPTYNMTNQLSNGAGLSMTTMINEVFASGAQSQAACTEANGLLTCVAGQDFVIDLNQAAL